MLFGLSKVLIASGLYLKYSFDMSYMEGGHFFCYIRLGKSLVCELDSVVQLGDLGLFAGHFDGYGSAFPVGLRGWCDDD
jgi:hypothetical protein